MQSIPHLNTDNFVRVAVASIFGIFAWQIQSWVRLVISLPRTSKRLENAKLRGVNATIDDIPGIAGWPIFGMFPVMLPYIRNKRTDLFFDGVSLKYGEISRICMKERSLISVVDPAVAKKVYNSPDNFVRGDRFQSLNPDIAPYALFVIPSGEQWKKHRKFLQPAFGPVHLREAFAVSLEFGDELLNIWEKNIKNGNPTRNLMFDFTMLTGDVISKVAFSANLGAVKSLDSNKDSEFNDHMEIIMNAFQLVITIEIFKINAYFSSQRSGVAIKAFYSLFGVSASQIEPSLSFIRNLLGKVIAEKKAKIAQKSAKEIGEDTWSHDLLDRLLTHGDKFSEEEIMSEMFGFFLAGHETTSNTLTWAFSELVKKPRVVAKLRQEIDELLNGSAPTLESLPSLSYLDAVIKETMRLCPVVALNGRVCIKECDVQLTDGNTLIVPKGALLLINNKLLQRSKKYWGEDADEFVPERWFVKNTNDSDVFVPVPGSYLPFADGPHNCIGQKMALFEAKVVLARIVQRFDFKLSNKQGPIVPVSTLTLGLKNGLLVDFELRK
ncbi:hypothetical protein HK096_004402 [Nowakowskiella sp. JEL0078]|nr:hypothetical protein HK096_004402 [Nowakowskiella sp. JEL0078]